MGGQRTAYEEKKRGGGMKILVRIYLRMSWKLWKAGENKQTFGSKTESMACRLPS